MGWIATRSPQPWRSRLRMASFRGARFHVETGSKLSGRRVALHEYPKRDDPYAEDMGRRAIRFDLVGYVIEGDTQLGRDYLAARDRLIDALEAEGGATLIHPTLPELKVICENYSVTETREKGGYAQFDMRFVEVGEPGNALTSVSSQSAGQSAVAGANGAASRSFSNQMAGAGFPAPGMAGFP